MLVVASGHLQRDTVDPTSCSFASSSCPRPNRHDTSGVVDVVSRGEIKLRSRPVRVEGRFRARVDAEGMVSDVFQILDAKVTDFK